MGVWKPNDAVAMMVRKSVRGCGFGFDPYHAMTQMTQMTQKRRWGERVGCRAAGSWAAERAGVTSPRMRPWYGITRRPGIDPSADFRLILPFFSQLRINLEQLRSLSAFS